MGYPRFVLFGRASAGWLRPEKEEVPDWNDELFTGYSHDEYWEINECQFEENQLPKYRKCRWFSFYFTGVASTSGVTFASHYNFHTSSEPTREQMELANKIGHLTSVPAIDIVVGGLCAKCTARDVR